MSRTRGEGTFFYSESSARWVGRIGEFEVVSKDKAKARTKWETAREKHRQGLRIANEPTVNDLWDALIEKKIKTRASDLTVDWYHRFKKSHLEPIGDIRADSITVDDIEAWLSSRGTLSESTLRKLRGDSPKHSTSESNVESCHGTRRGCPTLESPPNGKTATSSTGKKYEGSSPPRKVTVSKHG